MGLRTNDEKYFLDTFLNDKYSFGTYTEETIILWSPNLFVTLHERIDWYPRIEVRYDKLLENKFAIPKSSKINKVRPILSELFDDYYKFSLSSLSKITFSNNDEFYLDRSSNTIDLQSFSNDKKNPRNNLTIHLVNSIDRFELEICKSAPGTSRRPWKNNTTAISKDEFSQFVSIVLQYLSDRHSFIILMNDFITKYLQLCDDPSPFSGYLINPSVEIEHIYKQIELHKNFIEKQLIEDDNKTPLQRSSLRGQLVGLDFSLKTIKASRLK